MSKEVDHEDWVEVRARVDSLCNAAFLIAGGSLTLSINVFIGKNDAINESQAVDVITFGWYSLLISVVLFLVLKAFLIAQSYLRNTANPESFNKYLPASNIVGWCIALIAMASLIVGLLKLIKVAVLLVGA